MKLARLLGVKFIKTLRVHEKLRLDMSETSKIVNGVNKEIVYKKLGDLNNWYTRLIGLDVVKLYQDRVIALQEKLLAVQEKRREIGQELAEVRKKSNELQDQIHKVKRQDDLEGFLELMKQETEILRREYEINRTFVECDRQERDTFTAFTNAVRDSHEKQRAQVEYTKYFGLILSITGSFLAFCYSTLNKKDLKRIIQDGLGQTPTGAPSIILDQLEDNKKLLNDIRNLLNNSEKNNLTENVFSDLQQLNNDGNFNVNWIKACLLSTIVLSVIVLFKS